MKISKIEIRNRPGSEGEVSNGHNTEILLDGKQLIGVSTFHYNIRADGIGVVLMEMMADVRIETLQGLVAVMDERTGAPVVGTAPPTLLPSEDEGMH